MRKFQCHKQVQAEEIAFFRQDVKTGLCIFTLIDGSLLTLPGHVIARYRPKPGDYLVKYNDGYISVSPREAFEDGYTEVEQ